MPSPVFSNPVIRWLPALSMADTTALLLCLSVGANSGISAGSTVATPGLSRPACRASSLRESRLSSSAIAISQREESSLPRPGCRASTPDISDFSRLSALSRCSGLREFKSGRPVGVFAAEIGGCSVINLILKRAQAIFKVMPTGQWSEPRTFFKIKAPLRELSRPGETKK